MTFRVEVEQETDGRWIAVEAGTPERVAEDHDGGTAWTLFFRRQRPSERGADSEHRKEALGVLLHFINRQLAVAV